MVGVELRLAGRGGKDRIATRFAEWRVADGRALLVGGEEARLPKACPERFPLGAQCLDAVEIGAQLQALARISSQRTQHLRRVRQRKHHNL